jgi:hypothetical protein
MRIQVWKIPVNSQRPPDFVHSNDEPQLYEHRKAERARQFCFREGWIGIGWAIPGLNRDFSDHSEYLSALANTTEKDLGFRAKDAQGSCLAFAIDMNDGDFVWCRALGNTYWLGRIYGPWQYFHNDDFCRYDLHQVRKCKWIEVGSADNVPGPVLNAFAGRGMAISRIRRNEPIVLFASALLWENRTKEVVEIDAPVVGDAWANAISHDNLEDIVALYLQLEKGWIVIPSTVKKSTPFTEMVLRNKDAERAYVQVKSGAAIVRIDKSAIPNDVDVFYVFFPSIDNAEIESNLDSRIEFIKPETILKFMRENEGLMPSFVQLLIQQVGSLNPPAPARR